MKVPEVKGYAKVTEWCLKFNKRLTQRGLRYTPKYIHKILKENEDNKNERTIFKSGEVWFKYIVVGEQNNYLIKI